MKNRCFTCANPTLTSMALKPTSDADPWYRQLWPWLLISGPFTVVVAAFVTLWLAVKSDDGLVASDYYRRGLAINESLTRARVAEQLKLKAQFLLRDDARGVQVIISGNQVRPAQLRLRVVHPTRAVADQEVMLNAGHGGAYEATLDTAVRGYRLVVLEDVDRSWRLSGEARLAANKPLVLDPR
jgi:hypothetical protein